MKYCQGTVKTENRHNWKKINQMDKSLCLLRIGVYSDRNSVYMSPVPHPEMMGELVRLVVRNKPILI